MLGTRPIVAGIALGALAARSPLRHWGVTSEERRRKLPGDGLIPGERDVTTMATTIHASPAAIWPWLAQMGTDRAGWYSFDHLDNGGRSSADQLRPEWIHVQEGDRMATVPGRSWFDVVHVEPCRSLVLRASLDLRGVPFEPSGPRPRACIDARWEFSLHPRDDGSTRLLVRSGAAGAPAALTDVINVLFWDPVHVVMQLRQLQQLRRRAEGFAQAMGTGELRHEVSVGIR